MNVTVSTGAPVRDSWTRNGYARMIQYVATVSPSGLYRKTAQSFRANGEPSSTAACQSASFRVGQP